MGCEICGEVTVEVDHVATEIFQEGYDAGYAEAGARWSEDYAKILSRLSQIRELAR